MLVDPSEGAAVLFENRRIRAKLISSANQPEVDRLKHRPTHALFLPLHLAGFRNFGIKFLQGVSGYFSRLSPGRCVEGVSPRLLATLINVKPLRTRTRVGIGVGRGFAIGEMARVGIDASPTILLQCRSAQSSLQVIDGE